ncbi:hypothetical protein L249_4144 [Ophiocordyceps polyrhachis-furcata BCC 54312]|uniref:Uncharacterized protein n=1 Tax=Ophiocordyceps polyrhachis-furcata BCC 54312 TaxID=1330021 RepID=A0A367L5A1_9HYPO|nr:hypothetical protein L249_4144 [Ophiocordyceps polyrhachis-furcata BCC 54312]
MSPRLRKRPDVLDLELVGGDQSPGEAILKNLKNETPKVPAFTNKRTALKTSKKLLTFLSGTNWNPSACAEQWSQLPAESSVSFNYTVFVLERFSLVLVILTVANLCLTIGSQPAFAPLTGRLYAQNLRLCTQSRRADKMVIIWVAAPPSSLGRAGACTSTPLVILLLNLHQL